MKTGYLPGQVHQSPNSIASVLTPGGRWIISTWDTIRTAPGASVITARIFIPITFPLCIRHGTGSHGMGTAGTTPGATPIGTTATGATSGLRTADSLAAMLFTALHRSLQERAEATREPERFRYGRLIMATAGTATMKTKGLSGVQWYCQQPARRERSLNRHPGSQPACPGILL